MKITEEQYKDALFVVHHFEKENTWQKCPLCNGHSNTTDMYPCKICKGHKLISKQTGLPIPKS